MSDGEVFGGAPAVTLRLDPDSLQGPAFVGATILPGRGMMLLQARLRLPSGETVDAIMAPTTAEAARQLDGGAEDFGGNRSFSFGGAVLAPFTNRIRGVAVPGRREIATTISGRRTELLANWSGKAPGAGRYAMHGLILDKAFQVREAQADHVIGGLDAGDFAGRWPGRLRLDVEWRLDAGALRLTTTAVNVGNAAAPVGLGWHPYFKLPSGDRGSARLRLAARSRALVNNYDDVLPTGQVETVAGGTYDFRSVEGKALGELYLDDCFTDLADAGPLAELHDPGSRLGLRLSSPSAAIRALQVFAPPGQAFVVIEPQFNLADPYGREWGDRDTGMRLLQPGDRVVYEVRVEPFALRDTRSTALLATEP